MMVKIVYGIFIDKSRIYDFGLFALYTYIYSPNLSFQCTRAPNRFYHKTFLSVIASLAGRKSEMTIITHSLDMYRESSELYDQLHAGVLCFLFLNNEYLCKSYLS